MQITKTDTEIIELELEDLKTQIHNTLSEWENDDSTLKTLEKAMKVFCSNWDIAEGYKHAIMETVNDQIDNHIQEQDPADFRELLDILNGDI
tara:strand:- start:6680 stop:6955 length:276 start_codon:yes stop_codon:yes gene_type:complete